MKTLLILSSGRCVWDDIAKVTPWIGNYDTIAINFMVIHWPHELTYAASLHFDLLPQLVKVRRYRKSLNRPITYGIKPFDGIDFAGKFFDGDIETSGMYAAGIGLHLGYDKIILAGIPFDDSGHFYDPPISSRVYQESYRVRVKHRYCWPASKTWDKFRDKAGDRVRAVSGNLVKCFGELTREWVETPIQES